jgi:hypothetical protein
MNPLAGFFVGTILLGLGATLTFDLRTLLLKHACKMMPSQFA